MLKRGGHMELHFDSVLNLAVHPNAHILDIIHDSSLQGRMDISIELLSEEEKERTVK